MFLFLFVLFWWFEGVPVLTVYVQVENTGQKNMVLTVYELLEGEATVSQGRCMLDPWL